jgi:hypothetical protein
VPWQEAEAPHQMRFNSHTDSFAASAMREFSGVASRHGLSLIFDDGRNGKDQSQFVEHLFDEYKLLPIATAQPILEILSHNIHPRWAIDE